MAKSRHPGRNVRWRGRRWFGIAVASLLSECRARGGDRTFRCHVEGDFVVPLLIRWTLEGRVRMSRRSGATFAGCAGWVSARRQAGIGLIGLRQNRCCAPPMDRRPERRRRVPMPDTHYEILIIGAG